MSRGRKRNVCMFIKHKSRASARERVQLICSESLGTYLGTLNEG